MGSHAPRVELATIRPEPRVWTLVGAAATRPRNTATLGFLSLVGLTLLTSSMPLSGIAVLTFGVFAYSLFVLRDLFNPTLVREVHGLDRAHQRQLPPAPQLLIEEVAAPHRRLLSEIRDAHEAVRERLKESARELPGILERCDELALTSDALARRGVWLFDHLAAHPIAEASADLEHLETQLAATDDVTTRRALETTEVARRGYLGSLEHLEQMFHRATAQLAMIHSWLQLVETRLVELEAREGDLESPPSDLHDLSDLLAAELAGFEAIDALCERSPAEVSP